MKKQIKNIICISIIFSFLFVSLTPPVYAVALQTKDQKTASQNAAAKNALSWGVQGAKAVSKCALGFAAKAAINGLTNLVLSLLKIPSGEVSTKDQSAQNAAALANCVASVAVGLAKDQIVKITKSTFNWINTGLGGDPLYVSNMSDLLNRVENTLISSELSVFSDSQYAEMYPYGRDFASAQIQTQRSKSDHLYGLQSSLFDALTIDDQALNVADKLASYSHNFAQGGWNGWLSLTQNPQNNPLGFNMLATDQLAYQKEVAVTAKKEEVDAGGGIQDKKECVQYGVTTKKAEAATAANQTWGSNAEVKRANDLLNQGANALKTAKNKYDTQVKLLEDNKNKINPIYLIEAVRVAKGELAKAQADYDFFLASANKSNEAFKYTHNSKNEECTKYETVTPGSVIKDQLSKVITSPVVQLELVHTLEDALGSVLDNLMGKLQDNGIKRIDELFNTEKSTVPSMALSSSGELIMGETGSGSRRTGAFDLKDLGNTYTEVAAGEGNYELNDDGTFTEIGTGTGTGTWTSRTGSGTWTNNTGAGGTGIGTWGSLQKYIWNNSFSSQGGPIISDGYSIGSWEVTSTNGLGGTGTAIWTNRGSNGKSGTWTSKTGSGTWETSSAMNAATGTFEFETLPKYIWNNSSSSTGGPIISNGSYIGSWKVTSTNGLGGTGSANWTNTGSYGKSGNWTSTTGSGTWETSSAMNAATGTFEALPGGDTWSTKNNGDTGTWTSRAGSGTWIAKIGKGGTDIGTWKGDAGSVGDYILDKKGVIQIQKDYIVAAKQNVTLFNKIMPALGKLDYCIPGPNPNWELNSQDIDMDLQTTAKAVEGPYILELKNTYSNYMNKTYGPTSPMLNNDQSGFCVNGATNPPNCNIGSVKKDINLITTCPNYTEMLKSACSIAAKDDTENPLRYKKGDYVCIPSLCVGRGITAPTYTCKKGTLTPTTPTAPNLDNTPTCKVTTCDNFATNPPSCTKDDYDCKNGATNFPTCTTSVSRLEYLPMASSGLNLTAGMVQTDVNVTDAKTKYLTNIGDTESIQTELQNIANDYNKIIKKAQDRRNALLLTSTGDRATSVGPQCTFPDEFIN